MPNHVQDRKRARRRRPAPRRRSVWIAAALFGATTFVALLVLVGSRPRLPRIGDHWHARYRVVICDQEYPRFPPTPGGVHTHGDGVIHIHPQSRDESGWNANLGRFFGSAGVEFSQDRIAFPDGKTYRNGDRCPNGQAGTVRLSVNGTAHEDFERYVPQDGDTIVVEFR